MQRREFLLRLTVGGVAVPLVASQIGCSDDDDEMAMNPPPGTGGGTPSCPAGTNLDRLNVDNTGHVHTLSIPCDDVNSQAGLRTYTVSPYQGHEHDVTLDSIDFGTLLGGAAVNLTSTSTNGHVHTYSISLA